MSTTYLQMNLPVAAIGSEASTISLNSLLTASFGSNVQYITGVWLAYYGAPTLQQWNFQYWDMASPTVSRWRVNGTDTTAATANSFNQTYISNQNFGTVSLVLGDVIMPNAYMTVKTDNGGIDAVYSEYSISTVTASPNLPATGQAPTAAQIVATAISFDQQYPATLNSNDCHFIDQIVAAATGAPLNHNTQSLVPSQNSEHGFWRIAHRGASVSNWFSLTQPGDIVRFDWADPADSQHTTLILGNVQPDGTVEVYDNINARIGGTYIGRHFADYDRYSSASTVTIYRLTTDNLYLIQTTSAGETVLGTTFNDRIEAGLGNDVIRSGIGNDILLGGGGNDTLFGDEGLDTAGMTGTRSDYATAKSGGALLVADLRNGTPDGLDQLTSCERITFSNAVLGAEAFTPTNFNNDLKSDLLWGNSSGLAVSFLMNGLSITGATAIGGANGANWSIKAVGDLDGNGTSDLIWQNSSGLVVAYLMNGTAISSATVVGNAGSAFSVVGAGDLNRDGQSDIVLQNSNGQAVGWLMNGAAIQSAGVIGGANGANWRVKALGDLNLDGTSDLIWQDTNGSTVGFLMNGTNIASASQIAGANGTSFSVKGAGDLNADGRADIIWQFSNGQAGAWIMNGTSITTGGMIGGVNGSQFEVRDIADLNGDSRMDLVWQNTTNGQAIGFLMNGTSITSAGLIGTANGADWFVV